MGYRTSLKNRGIKSNHSIKSLAVMAVVLSGVFAVGMPVSCFAQVAATTKLTDAIVRVPRVVDDDPGKVIEAAHRIMLAKNLGKNTELGRLLTAYLKGESRWIGDGGAPQSMKLIGLAVIDWPSQEAIPAWKSPREVAPFVRTVKEDTGTLVGLSPIEIAEGLSCSVSFRVLSNTADIPRAEELDFLAGQIELYGGGFPVREASPLIEADTFFDFWNSTRGKRYSISKWESNGVGHFASAYGPLLFEVLSSDPDFLLLENLKIELPERFREGCRELCAEVLKLRKAQGQMDPPVCRLAQPQ